jgi:hypothetical protein
LVGRHFLGTRAVCEAANISFDQNAILFTKGMLGATGNSRWGRRLGAAWLAVFFCLASLTPIAAQSLNDSLGGMACCKAKGKCCCRKHPDSNGQSARVITAASCLDCENMAVNGGSPTGLVPIRFQVLTVAIEANGKVRIATVIPRSQISTHSLLQRPPPAFAA